MHLHIAGVSAVLDSTEIVSDIDLEVEPGECVGLVGPNGSGKSTLLRCAYRVLRPSTGAVHIGGDDIWGLDTRESARRIGVVAQESTPGFDLAVWEVVILGRTPHKRRFDRETSHDHHLVDEALTRVGMGGFADRDFGTLSGGEKQRVLLARALAQEARLLVLDEPTNHLDVHFQLAILELIDGLGLTTIAALHDLNLAAAYCDRVYVLSGGEVVASGTPDDVLTPELVGEVFGVHADRMRHPRTGRLVLAFSSLDLTRDGPGRPMPSCRAGAARSGSRRDPR